MNNIVTDALEFWRLSQRLHALSGDRDREVLTEYKILPAIQTEINPRVRDAYYRLIAA